MKREKSSKEENEVSMKEREKCMREVEYEKSRE